jgi:hypothetical protein
MALDASATPTIVAPSGRANNWAVTGYDTDVSTAIEIKAAPGAGISHYITGVIITSDDDDANPQLQDGDGTLLFGPFMSNANGILQVAWQFKCPLKVTTNKAIALKAAAAGNVSIYVEGFTLQDNKA